jgi:hypothetical protein
MNLVIPKAEASGELLFNKQIIIIIIMNLVTPEAAGHRYLKKI